jgi:hypothetical protein
MLLLCVLGIIWHVYYKIWNVETSHHKFVRFEVLTVLWLDTNIFEKHTVFSHEDGGNMFL